MTRTTAVAVLALATAAGVAAGADMKTFENAELKYAIQLPATCRHAEGPGTLEAICAPDLDAKKSAEIAAAASFLLEVDAEAVPGDAKPYGEAEFRQELPEAVCGEGDAGKVKLAGVTVAKEGDRTTFRATVTCPDIKFLQLPERTAEVRYVMAAKFRYRLMARYPAGDAAKTRPVADAFFASFKPVGGS